MHASAPLRRFQLSMMKLQLSMMKRPRHVALAATVGALSVFSAWDSGPFASSGQARTSLASAVKRADTMHYEWLVSNGALLRLFSAGLPKVLLQAYFNHPTTLLIGAKQPNALVPNASLASDFTSAAALISALDEHRIAKHEKYVVLDLEAWRMTPFEEQRQPI
jgi:hypothetical protein